MQVSSWASSDAVRNSMLGNRSRDTKPELAVRRLIHAGGLRYRTSFRPIATLRRTADLVFTRAKVAVFIDGCFWHACPAHYRAPATNPEYWSPKIERNRLRDLDTTTQLESAGWIVLRYWSHEDPAVVAALVSEVVQIRRLDAGAGFRYGTAFSGAHSTDNSASLARGDPTATQ